MRSLVLKMRDEDDWDDLILIVPGSFNESGKHSFNNVETLFYLNKSIIDKLYYELFVAYYEFHDGELNLTIDGKDHLFPVDIWIDLYGVVFQYLEAHHKAHQLEQEEVQNI